MPIKILVLLLLLNFTIGFNYFRGSRCLLHNGKCIVACPKGMHPYNTVCSRDTISQRTCDQPYVYTLGYTCGWSRCDCNGDMVLNEKIGICVNVDVCPRGPTRKKKRRKNKHTQRAKKVVVKDDNEDLE